MSAWVVSNAHITALAVYAVRNKITNRSVEECAAILYEENCKSVDFRYGEYNKRNFALCEWAAFHKFSTMEIYKSARCLDYQSCEHDSYRHSEAKRICDAVEDHALMASGMIEAAISKCAEYDQAPWGIEILKPIKQAA